MMADVGQGLCIAGIDPGSTTLGIAFMWADPVTLDINKVLCYTLTPYARYQMSTFRTGTQADLTVDDRLELLGIQIKNYVRKYKPIAMGIEGPFFNRRRPAAFAPLVMQVSKLTKVMKVDFPYMDVIKYQPLTIKAAFKAKNAKGKDPMKKALLTNEEIMNVLSVSVETLTDHSIDATAVCYTHLQKLRRHLCK